MALCNRWRLIVTRGLDGATNMALDEAVARLAGAGDSPVLRLFDWSPWAISLGYHQAAADIDLARCSAEGVDVVRRPTGGRAILHAEEITYSVVFPASSREYSKGVLATYASVSLALAEGLKGLGLAVSFVTAERPLADFRSRSCDVPCFASHARHELQVGGRKIVGSAQRRYPKAVLQHGSILLGAEHLHLAELMRVNGEEKRWLRMLLEERTAWLNQIAGRSLTFEEVAEKIVEGFRNVYQAEFEPVGFTSPEGDLARGIRHRYEIAGGKKDEAVDSLCNRTEPCFFGF